MSGVRARLWALANRALLPLSEAWWSSPGASVHRIEEFGIRSCLVVVSHPDDETIGCGATIASLVAQAIPVRVVVATDGRHSAVTDDGDGLSRQRMQELGRAMSVLGLEDTNVVRWDFEDGTLGENGWELRKRLAGCVDMWRPDTVIGHWRLDPHPDHAALAAAVEAVSSERRLRLLEFPVWGRRWPATALAAALGNGSWHRYLRSLAGQRLRVAAGAGAVAKLSALACYASQIRADVSVPGLSGMPSGTLDETFLRLFLGPEERFFYATPVR